MDINQIKTPITQFVHNLPKSITVDQVLVFGSHLEGTASEDSDIDVIVVSQDFQQMDEDQRLDILYEARQLVEPEVHPWGFTQDELRQAGNLTTLGYVRDHGLPFLPK